MKQIKQFIRRLFPKLFVMPYYDQDDLYTITTYLTENIFPKNGTVVSIPIAVDNTVNNIYYLLALQGENTLTLKIDFNENVPSMDIMEINMRNFEIFYFVSFIEYISINFLKHRLIFSEIFNGIKQAKEIANRRR